MGNFMNFNFISNQSHNLVHFNTSGYGAGTIHNNYFDILRLLTLTPKSTAGIKSNKAITFFLFSVSEPIILSFTAMPAPGATSSGARLVLSIIIA